ncbi:HLH-domain-containing protein [Trichodelitschia bisporula]|uniref:HLH-domain-containing protein n=1 Tax=Trichodelitschia bisporula TaxID=703511 RepID=A0A6G1I029_9PEZI|nr:HLH-domain-containing protein [Trichodelitschia bisporula]
MATLPTPPSSTSIPTNAKRQLSTSTDEPFLLPPPALPAADSLNSASSSTSTTSSSTTSSASSSTSSASTASSSASARTTLDTPQEPRPRPAKRRRANDAEPPGLATAAPAKYTLPPPPTRARKIIQMNVRAKATEAVTAGPARRGNREAAGSGAGAAGAVAPAGAAGPGSAAARAPASGRRKDAGPSTVAAKKVARKKAHSAIERKRRSKMNEEFDTLRDLVPACRGRGEERGKMHKLAILQAAIEYVRYLQTCLETVKAAHQAVELDPTPRIMPQRHPDEGDYESSEPEGEDEGPEEGEDDVEYEELGAGALEEPEPAFATRREAESISPTSCVQPQLHFHPYPPPQTYLGPAPRHSAQSSPMLPPLATLGLEGAGVVATAGEARWGRGEGATGSVGASPAGGSGEEGEATATAALMMLTKDRRAYSWDAGGRGGEGREGQCRGMSVRDLLSG